MANIDIAAFMEKCGIRKARFGGLEAEDVRLAVQALAAEYETQLDNQQKRARKAANTTAALEQHCQNVINQNQALNTQNASLAGSNQSLTRQLSALHTTIDELKARNASLHDQNAILILKNNDLTKENKQLQEEADTAGAELTVKGRALDAEKNDLQARRKELISNAEAQAADILKNAKAKARRAEDTAIANAAAIDRAARTQARAQAQELVDSATREANEIYSIHQLRLDNLKSEATGMETYRDALLDYLNRTGRELLDLDARIKAGLPAFAPAPLAPAPTPELKTLGEVKAEVDLSPAVIARASNAIARANRAQHDEAAANAPTPTGTPVFVSVTSLHEEDEEVPAAPVKEEESSVTLAETPADAPDAYPDPELPAPRAQEDTIVPDGTDEEEEPAGDDEDYDGVDEAESDDEEDAEQSAPDDLPAHRPSAQVKPTTQARRPTLPPEPDHLVPGEVPGAPVGAIFSSPIVNPAPDIARTAAPRPGPRAPVMPSLPDDDDFDTDLPGYPGDETPPAAAAAGVLPTRGDPAAHKAAVAQNSKAVQAAKAAGAAKQAVRRAKALRAVRALRRIRATHRNGPLPRL